MVHAHAGRSRYWPTDAWFIVKFSWKSTASSSSCRNQIENELRRHFQIQSDQANNLKSPKITLLAVLLASITSASCGGSGGGNGEGSVGGVDTGNGNSDEDDTVDTPVISQQDCVETLSGLNNVNKSLINFDSTCDYYVNGLTRFNGDTTIEAGTVIVVSSEASVSFEDGTLTATGTEGEPIVFRGQTSERGHWRGVRIFDNTRVDLEHVAIQDAGARLSNSVNISALTIGTNTDVSLQQVSVSNSAHHGLEFSGSLADPDLELGNRWGLSRFSENRFFGNAGAGVQAMVAMLNKLDYASDYLGIEQPNGMPFVQVGRLSLSGEEEFSIPALGAPLRFGSEDLGSIFVSLSARLDISPGAEILLPANSSIEITNRAAFSATGTPQNPIVFSSSLSETWGGIRLNSQGDIVLSHVLMDNASGYSESLSGAIAVSGSASPDLDDMTIFTTADWGIFCSQRTFGPLDITEIVTTGAALGSMHPDCGDN